MILICCPETRQICWLFISGLLSLSLFVQPPPPPTEGTTIRGCRSKSVPETRKVHSSQAHKSLLPPVLCPGSSNNGNNLFCVAFSPLVANRTPGNAVLLKNSRTSLASAACCLLCRRVCLRGYLFPRREKSVSLKTGGRGGGRWSRGRGVMVVGDGWGCGLEVCVWGGGGGPGGGVGGNFILRSAESQFFTMEEPEVFGGTNESGNCLPLFSCITVRFPLIHIIIRSWQNRPQISDSASVVTFLQRRQQISEYWSSSIVW